MVPMNTGFAMLNEANKNAETRTVIGGFVAGVATTLALIGLFAGFNK